MINLPKPYTTREVAAFLGVDPITIRNECKRGKLDYFKVGTDYRFTEDHLKKYMGIVNNECNRKA